MNKFYNLKFSGNKELEASIAPFHGCNIDDGITNDSPNLLVLPQYYIIFIFYTLSNLLN